MSADRQKVIAQLRAALRETETGAQPTYGQLIAHLEAWDGQIDAGTANRPDELRRWAGAAAEIERGIREAGAMLADDRRQNLHLLLTGVGDDIARIGSGVITAAQTVGNVLTSPWLIPALIVGVLVVVYLKLFRK